MTREVQAEDVGRRRYPDLQALARRDKRNTQELLTMFGLEGHTAQLLPKVDINVGDPVWPAPQQVELPRLLGGEPLRLRGYPLHLVLAEKIVTAVFRGTGGRGRFSGFAITPGTSPTAMLDKQQRRTRPRSWLVRKMDSRASRVANVSG